MPLIIAKDCSSLAGVAEPVRRSNWQSWSPWRLLKCCWKVKSKIPLFNPISGQLKSYKTSLPHVIHTLGGYQSNTSRYEAADLPRCDKQAVPSNQIYRVQLYPHEAWNNSSHHSPYPALVVSIPQRRPLRIIRHLTRVYWRRHWSWVRCRVSAKRRFGRSSVWGSHFWRQRRSWYGGRSWNYRLAKMRRSRGRRRGCWRRLFLAFYPKGPELTASR